MAQIDPKDLGIEPLWTRRNIIREFWENLPIWFFYLEALGLLYFIMANISEADFKAMNLCRQILGATAFFPLLVVYFYYRLRIRDSKLPYDKIKLHRQMLAIIFGIPFCVWLFYTIFPFFRITLEQNGVRKLFEIMQVSWILIFMVHTWWSRGIHRFITVYVIALLYGVILENTGIYLGYFSEPHYMWYFGKLPAPFCTMLGWCLVFYACIWIAEFFRERFPTFAVTPLRSALLATAIAIALDLQLDPLASLSGVFWKWNESQAPWFLGVPFCNYAAWFGAFISFAWAYFYVVERKDLTIFQKHLKLLAHVPLIAIIAGLIWMALMIIYDRGFSGPTFKILSEFFSKITPYGS